MPRYRLSGFVLQSDAPLPELLAARGNPTHVFELDAGGRTAGRPRWYHHWQETADKRWLSFGRTPRGYVLRFRSLVDFELSRDLTRIRARPLRAVRADTLRHLLLDQVWPLVLSGSGRLVMHASAIVRPDGRAVAFAGPAAVGKSSLAAAMASTGCRLLSDDCLLLAKSGRGWRAVPGYPGVRLWPDMLAAVAAGGEEVSDVAHYTSKKRLAATAVPFARRAAPLSAVYLLRARSATAKIRIAPLTGAAALMELVPFTYLLDFEARAQLERSFAHLAALTTTVPILRLDLPHAARRIAEVTERLLRR